MLQTNQPKLQHDNATHHNKTNVSNNNTLNHTEFPSLDTIAKLQLEDNKKSKKNKKRGKKEPIKKPEEPVKDEDTDVTASVDLSNGNRISLGDNVRAYEWNKKTMDIATKIKLQQLQEKFSNVKQELVTRTFEDCGCKYDETLHKLVESYGEPQENPLPNQSKTSGFKAADVKPKVWVPTGETVRGLYEDYREEAIKHASTRNMCFHYATNAYLAGNGLAARQWSDRGRYHDDMMKKLHSEACNNIFSSRNETLSSDKILDLHGLHKKEAIEVLEKRLSSLHAYNSSSYKNGQQSISVLYIITGTGHHSESGKSLVGNAVRKYLLEKHLKFSDCSEDRRGGMLMKSSETVRIALNLSDQSREGFWSKESNTMLTTSRQHNSDGPVLWTPPDNH